VKRELSGPVLTID